MTSALARSLLLADAVTREALAEALLVCASQRTSLVRALLATGAVERARLEQHLEQGHAPMMRHIAPVMSLVEHLPPGLCDRLLALPVRRDPRTGTVDVAVVDARDPHPVEEVAYWVKAPVRMVRTSLASMDSALRRIQVQLETGGARSLAPPIWVPSPSEPASPRAPTPVYGTPLLAPELPGSAPAGQPAREIDARGVGGHNIPFPLQRRHGAELANGLGLDPVAEAEGEPVLDLRRRKSLTPPPLGMAAPQRDSEPRDTARWCARIREAAERDAILELLAEGAALVASRVAVLAVKRGVLAGWTCSPETADREHLRAARVATAMSDVFTQALANDAACLARIPLDAAHAPLLGCLREPLLRELALVPVKVEGKPVVLLLAEPLGGAHEALGPLEELATAASDALSEVLRIRRR